MVVALAFLLWGGAETVHHRPRAQKIGNHLHLDMATCVFQRVVTTTPLSATVMQELVHFIRVHILGATVTPSCGRVADVESNTSQNHVAN